jgi:hypothetical protein
MFEHGACLFLLFLSDKSSLLRYGKKRQLAKVKAKEQVSRQYGSWTAALEESFLLRLCY